jgi:hypothetical protein
MQTYMLNSGSERNKNKSPMNVCVWLAVKMRCCFRSINDPDAKCLPV